MKCRIGSYARSRVGECLVCKDVTILDEAELSGMAEFVRLTRIRPEGKPHTRVIEYALLSCILSQAHKKYEFKSSDDDSHPADTCLQVVQNSTI